MDYRFIIMTRFTRLTARSYQNTDEYKWSWELVTSITPAAMELTGLTVMESIPGPGQRWRRPPNVKETDGWDITVTTNAVDQSDTFTIIVSQPVTSTVHVTSDPYLKDTDFDGLSDFEEWQFGTNPRLIDTDGDGLTDLREINLGTDIANFDTDGDGLDEGAELTFGSDPGQAIPTSMGFLTSRSGSSAPTHGWPIPMAMGCQTWRSGCTELPCSGWIAIRIGCRPIWRKPWGPIPG
jgi:hypothetical protein